MAAVDDHPAGVRLDHRDVEAVAAAAASRRKLSTEISKWTIAGLVPSGSARGVELDTTQLCVSGER